ncbi:DOPA 4,5-dioxygenase family protein [Rhizobium calliandrae]|uniref:DOPA 4,5-dioxygenase family protein n=1 Tax=Rhizobium calliandrae TaxID=1312182 RepID=A0ABT7KP54_9HYPH|nr:DOPA 4,5-dioxygenase family protein [Rhizobium calliandrae]MDL2410379.1 DOPA 4,5-dioxygenase family protein [Rhizobium calliandrae]
MTDTDHPLAAPDVSPIAPARPIDSIWSYHAHIYFEGPEQARVAAQLRAEIADRFPVVMGRWWDQLIGPHARPMYQVAFPPAEFARLVPWLMINRRGLAILIHPNTGEPKPDHLTNAMWLGEILDIHSGPLPDHEEREPALVPNTQPVVNP